MIHKLLEMWDGHDDRRHDIVFKGMDTYDNKNHKGELKACLDAARCDKYSNL